MLKDRGNQSRKVQLKDRDNQTRKVCLNSLTLGILANFPIEIAKL